MDIKELKRLHEECPAWQRVELGFIGSDKTPFILSAGRDGFRLPTGVETVLAFHLRNALPALLERVERAEALEAERNTIIEQYGDPEEDQCLAEVLEMLIQRADCERRIGVRNSERAAKAEAQVAALREALTYEFMRNVSDYVVEQLNLAHSLHEEHVEHWDQAQEVVTDTFFMNATPPATLDLLTDTAAAAEAYERRIRADEREPLEGRIAELEETQSWLLEAAQLADYFGEDPDSAINCIRQWLTCLHAVMDYLQEPDAGGLVAAIKQAVIDERRKVLAELAKKLDREADELASWSGGPIGSNFRIDEKRAIARCIRDQVAALDAPNNTNCGTKAANIPVSD